MNFGEKILHLRLSADKTESETADILRISKRKYTKIENGRIEIFQLPISFIWRIADVYGVSIDYLVGRNSEKNYKQPHLKVCKYCGRLFHTEDSIVEYCGGDVDE
ncbi:MAG: helix-turn-helix domain-containing protein [Prevotellaceae bacterium]|jgi:transcriptional regulator with XRE-family HTH domain|nr:helix-turn-helix domain-containing protein [Prevotellaceae bacterium]